MNKNADKLKNHYISNCIRRIFDAPCENRCMQQRADDVAFAVEISATEGLDVAHKYLIKLCDQSEKGKYGEVKE